MATNLAIDSSLIEETRLISVKRKKTAVIGIPIYTTDRDIIRSAKSLQIQLYTPCK